MIPSKITFCPKCKKPVSSKDFFSTSGSSDWRVEGPGILIRCSKCDYYGLPVEASFEEYKKIIEK